VTATGQVILMVVDGRSSGSIGATLYELGLEMKALGAVDAVNLDGGGSATMWIKGLGVVNHPTDSSGERPVSNAIVILPGADTAEAAPLAARAAI
jgi:exopolysaccharide biosynthesis protein